MTLYAVTAPNEHNQSTQRCIVMIGKNRQYIIGDTAYAVAVRSRKRPFAVIWSDKLAKLSPVVWVNGKWTPTQLTTEGTLNKEWTVEVTLIDTL